MDLTQTTKWIFEGNKQERFLKIKTEQGQLYRLKIFNLYNSGIGLKLLARDYLNISYTQIRRLFGELDLDIRRGRNVVTDNLRKLRSIKAINEKKNLSGWFDPNLKRKIKISDRRGVQGYYYNKSKNSYVWLRSTYEFIYANWLDNTNQNWDVELTHFTLNDGRIYRPDFFIMNNDKFTIVEIKGYWDNNTDKAKLLLKEQNIEVSIICGLESIKKYLPFNKSYETVLKEWKQIRKRKIDIG